jgi:ribonuclease-3 family protein
VLAEHQAHLLEKLKKDFPLSDKETQIFMRGRNSVTRSKNRRNPAAYQDSTAFEALIGYLYICDQQRCCELLNWLDTIVDEAA